MLRFALLQQTIERSCLTNPAELDTEGFDLNEKLLQINDLLVSYKTLNEDAHQPHLQKDNKKINQM